MEEVAESMINGELCEQCGSYIGEATGYPRKCEDCVGVMSYKEIEQAKRLAYCKKELITHGIEIIAETETCLEFMWKGERVKIYPYSGWHTGKTIRDGRGIKNLLIQLVDGK